MSTVMMAAERLAVRLASMAKTAAKPAAKRAKKRSPARIGRPPGQLSEVTRKNILVAARDCFAQMGFARATNRDIAAAAGVTAAAIYRHFDSKAELYAAVVHDSLAGQVPRMRTAVESAASVRAAFGALLRTAGDEGQLAEARFLSGVPTEMQRHPEVARCMLADPGEVYGVVRTMMEAGVRRGEIPREKMERAVALVIASLMGISSYTNTLGRVQGERAVAGLLDLLEGKLFVTVARG
jgi:AcrR family transcriptional regulator